jgi:hypothetical protein
MVVNLSIVLPPQYIREIANSNPPVTVGEALEGNGNRRAIYAHMLSWNDKPTLENRLNLRHLILIHLR